MTEPHAITRIRERYGIEATLADLDRMAADVAAGKTLKLNNRPDGTTTHAVLCRERAVIAVVGGNGRIVTVLPRERDWAAGRKRR